MTAPPAALALFAAGALVSCNVPGIRPEGRDITIGVTSEATGDEIHDTVIGWLSRQGFAIRADRSSDVEAEKPIGPADPGAGTHASILEVSISAPTGGASRVEVHGHTVIVGESAHRFAVELAGSTPQDAEELAGIIGRMSAPR